MLLDQWKVQTDRAFRICTFGSSNTELSFANNGRHNWVDWFYINLRQEIGSHVTVTNLGIGGETTINLLDRIERDVKPHQPALVIVTIGGNDANHEMPVKEYTERLKKICSLILQYQAIPVLQTYYCPVYHLSNDNFQTLFEAYMQVNRELSQEFGIPLIDQYAFFEPFYRSEPDEYEKLMRDWLHVNYLGNLVMAQVISRAFGLSFIPIPDDIANEFNPLYEKMLALLKLKSKNR
jgi:lysophospholipase L1-like esterase